MAQAETMTRQEIRTRFGLTDGAFLALGLEAVGERTASHAGRRALEYRASDVRAAVGKIMGSKPRKAASPARKAATKAKTHGHTRKASPPKREKATAPKHRASAKRPAKAAPTAKAKPARKR